MLPGKSAGQTRQTALLAVAVTPGHCIIFLQISFILQLRQSMSHSSLLLRAPPTLYRVHTVACRQ